MKIKLIMLPQPILVSNSEPEVKDVVFFTNGQYFFSDVIEKIGGSSRDIVLRNMPEGREKGTLDYREMYKVIAGIPDLPSIDFSALSQEDCKKIGWVDVQRLAIDKFPYTNEGSLEDDIDAAKRRIWIDGFITAQSLNEKKFTEEDLKKAMKSAMKQGGGSSSFEDRDFINTSIKSLSQSKVFDVEVETEDAILDNGNKDNYTVWQPKITNNSIKIIKVL